MFKFRTASLIRLACLAALFHAVGIFSADAPPPSPAPPKCDCKENMQVAVIRGAAVVGNRSTSDVGMSGFSYSTPTITINVGDTIKWTNNGGSHTVTDDGGAFESGNLNQGDTFQHTYNTAGSFPYHCQYHQGFGMVATVVVQAPPVSPTITSGSSKTLTVGAAGTFTVTTTGTPTPAIAIGGDALPSGVTFVDNQNGTGTLSGTPAAASGKVYSLTFTATNSAGSTPPQVFTLTVNETAAVSSAATTTFNTGTAGTFTVTAIGFPKPTTLARTGALPSGVTYTDNGNGTGTLAGGPAAGTGGTYPLTFTPTSSLGQGATQQFTLTVNEKPLITSGAATEFSVGALGSFTITTTGFPKAAIARGGDALPGGVTFTDNGNGTAKLEGTPAAGSGKVYAFTFTATSAAGTSPVQSFALTVKEAPTITSAASAAFPVGTQSTFTVKTTGFPKPSIALQAAALPASISYVDNGDGTSTFSGTPTAVDVGTYPLTLTAANGVGSSFVQNFTFNVTNDPKFTSADHVTFTVGTQGTFSISAGGNPIPQITLVSGALPPILTIVPNGANGTSVLSGIPSAGTGGAYVLGLKASNGVGTDATQNFLLRVDEAPLFTSAANTTFEVGVAGTFTVTTTGFPIPSLNRGGGQLPSGVTFTDNADGTGTFSGTPAAGTSGSYGYPITAFNSVGNSAIQIFTLQINQKPVINSPDNTLFTIGTAGNFTVTTTALPTAAIAIGGVALPSGVSFTDNGDGTGSLGGTPGAGNRGTYALTFTATNSAGSSAVQNFTLSVNEKAVISSPLSATAFVGVDFSYTITTSGPATPVPVLSTDTLPAGLTRSGAVISGRFEAAGQFTIALTSTNDAGADTKNLVVTVTVPAPETISGAWSGAIKGKLYDRSGTGEASVAIKNMVLNVNFTPIGRDLYASADFGAGSSKQILTGRIGLGNAWLDGMDAAGDNTLTLSLHVDKKGASIKGEGVVFTNTGIAEITFILKRKN